MKIINGSKIMNNEYLMEKLDIMFPNPKCELNYNKDYELLLSVMLSAQTTDKRVNEVTKELYKKYNTLEKLNNLSLKEIESYLKSLGFYRTKAKHFKEIVFILNKIGYVKNDRDFLESLSGVGRKTASVVLSTLFDEPNFAVDTHVFRVAKVFNITNEEDDVLKAEEKLKKFFPKEKWNRTSSQMVLFGRYICTAKKRKCDKCLIDKCDKKDIINNQVNLSEET